MPLERIAAVVSHPQASGQCAAFIRTRLPGAAVVLAASTAEAVRLVAERDSAGEAPWAAIGSRTAAALYGCEVLEADVEDAPGSETRFVWIARDDAGPGDRAARGRPRCCSGSPTTTAPAGSCAAWPSSPTATSTSPASSRGRAGRASARTCSSSISTAHAGTPAVAEAIEALRTHAAAVRVLGSFPTAP